MDNDHTVYIDLKELNGLQFKAKGFPFLPKQTVHSVLTAFCNEVDDESLD